MNRLTFCCIAAVSILYLGMTPSASQQRQHVLNCSIKPQKVIDISSPIGGVLSDVFVRPGQKVAAGELIARLDTDIQQAELEGAMIKAAARGAENVARARRSAAASQFEAANMAYENQVLPKVEFTKIRADLQVADQELARSKEGYQVHQAEVIRLEVLISKGEIRAPEAGIIGEELLSKSEAVDGRAVAQLIVTNPLKVEVFANARAIENIEAGEEYVLVAGINDPQVFPITLDYIFPIADPRSKVIKAIYTLKDTAVRPGTQCFVSKKDAVDTALDLARGRRLK